MLSQKEDGHSFSVCQANGVHELFIFLRLVFGNIDFSSYTLFWNFSFSPPFRSVTSFCLLCSLFIYFVRVTKKCKITHDTSLFAKRSREWGTNTQRHQGCVIADTRTYMIKILATVHVQWEQCLKQPVPHTGIKGIKPGRQCICLHHTTSCEETCLFSLH